MKSESIEFIWRGWVDGSAVRALTTLTEVLGSFPTTHKAAQPFVTPVSGAPTSSFDL